MDRGDWQTTVYGVKRVGHNLVTKPRPPWPYYFLGKQKEVVYYASNWKVKDLNTWEDILRKCFYEYTKFTI